MLESMRYPPPASARPEPITIRGRDFRWGSRTFVMGIINLTPDSFSGDGLDGDPDAAVRRAVSFQSDGADIIDVGGESTRPGHRSVAVERELERVVPAIERIAREVDLPISVDTWKAEVARQALAAGASVVNDVWGLRRDPEMALVAARAEAVVLMHNQETADYRGDVVAAVVGGLRRSLACAAGAGIAAGRMIVDPGIGFGKRPEHNLEVLRRLPELRALGRPVLVGTSRKSTIGIVLGGLPVEERLEGTAATVALAVAGLADVVRVHDVRAMARVARMADAIVRGWP